MKTVLNISATNVINRDTLLSFVLRIEICLRPIPLLVLFLYNRKFGRNPPELQLFPGTKFLRTRVIVPTLEPVTLRRVGSIPLVQPIFQIPDSQTDFQLNPPNTPAQSILPTEPDP